MRLLTVQLEHDNDENIACLVFTFENAWSTFTQDMNPAPVEVRCSGGGGSGSSNVFIDKVGYQNIPSDVHHFSLMAYIPYVLSGLWQVAWNSPLLSGSTQTAELKPCVTRDLWDQLVAQTESLPSELGGKLLVKTPEDNSASIRSLDGTNSRKLADGNWYSLLKTVHDLHMLSEMVCTF